MRTFTAGELKAAVDSHGKWLRDEPTGSRADLTRADLTGANLRGANLGGADLRGADLTGADLTGANLTGANLRDANLRDADLGGADLTGADLRDANLGGANLGGADLRGANLRGANLGGADLRGAKDLAKAIGWLPMAPVVPDLDRRMAEVTVNANAFDMSTWHGNNSCGTTHCRAGWAITLAGEAGRVLEACVGPAVAGTLIYVRSTGRPAPDFSCSNEEALADIAACAANPGKPITEDVR